MQVILRNLAYCTRGQARKLGRNKWFPGGTLAFIPCHVKSALAVFKKRTDLGEPEVGGGVGEGRGLQHRVGFSCVRGLLCCRRGLQGGGIIAAIQPSN